MTQIANINRRRFDRFSFQDTFVLETEKFDGISSTFSVNMSQKGAHLLSKKPYTQGAVISIEVPSQKIQMMGEVCWVGPQHNQQYNIGVAFHEFFPTTKSKIANLIDRIQTEPDSNGPVFSYQLEQNVSQFLDPFIEEMKPEPLVQAPVSYRRLGTPTEKTLSFFTPSRPQTLEGTTTSFRIDEKIASRNLPTRALLLAGLALSLFFFRSVFTQSLQHWITPSVATHALTKAKPMPHHHVADPEPTEVVFQEGLIEKIQWNGSSDQLQMTFTLRNQITPAQIQTNKIIFDGHPRELIKILDVDGQLMQKNILINHALVDQVRMGMHDEQGIKNLHIVIDMTSKNISVTSTQSSPTKLTLEFQYGQKSKPLTTP